MTISLKKLEIILCSPEGIRQYFAVLGKKLSSFPRLRLAQATFCIPAISTPVERLSSAAGRIVSARPMLAPSFLSYATGNSEDCK